MCEYLTNVIKEFGRLYLGINNCEPTGDLKKIEEILISEQIRIRTKLIKTLSEPEEYLRYEYDDDGPYINHEHFRKLRQHGEAKFVDVHRGYVLSEEVITHELYPPFKEFLRYFPGKIQIKGRLMRLTGPIFTHDEQAYILCDVTNRFYPFSTTADEWIQFFADEYGADFGDARLFINCNPKSDYYGRIGAVTIADEISIRITEYQFGDWLGIMVAHADTFLARRADAPVYIDECWESIVDIINRQELFNCDEYFQSKSKVIITAANIIPACLVDIVIGYITYADSPQYNQSVIFDDLDDATLLRYGLTQELINDLRL